LDYKWGVARFDVRVVGPPERDPRFFDARSLGLRVERNNVEFQVFTVLVTGHERLLKHPRLVSQPDFWRAAVTAACEELPAQIHGLGVPTADPTQAVDLFANYGRVEQLLSNAQPLLMIATDMIVASWTE
jgi:hypothetical protein